MVDAAEPIATANPDFGSLVEQVADFVAKRSGEVAGAKVLLRRAEKPSLDQHFETVPYMERHLESGALQRPLPDWHADLGAISLYFTGQKFLPTETPAFVDYVTTAFREQNLARRFSADG